MHELSTPELERDDGPTGAASPPALPTHDADARASARRGVLRPAASARTQADRPTEPAGADFGKFAASADARRVADWVVRTGDHRHVPFLIIDKVAATVFLFDADGRAQASAPVLLGVGRGDVFAPGVIDKDMHQMRPEERITPAGRFVGEMGIDDKDKHVLWIDYDAGIALHAVLDNPGEHRRQRLASPTVADNRISYGCVNVPTAFFEKIVRPTFERGRGRVYVLPEKQPAPGFFEALARNAPVAAAGSHRIASTTNPAH
jgi:hypothetical protein